MSDVLDQLFSPSRETERFYGLCVGIVTNNQDPEGMGRVKVRFPWLSGQHESAWARIAAPMAGPGRGAYFLPEVDDEVLVGFEHGIVEFPYVVGALWNGKDQPPVKNEDGKNNLRLIRSRSGHTIRLDDTDGKEKVEIWDKDGKNSIVIDSANNAITITAAADIQINCSQGKLSLVGKDVEVQADDKMTLQAGGEMVIKGATVNIN
jgi:uncharacterized protein involved in type VI secretion and phage assembly